MKRIALALALFSAAAQAEFDPVDIVGMPRPQDWPTSYTTAFDWERELVTIDVLVLQHMVTRLSRCGHPVELHVQDVPGTGDVRVPFAQWAPMVRTMRAHPDCWLTAKGGVRI